MEVREMSQKAIIIDKKEASKLRNCFEYLRHRMTKHSASNGIENLKMIGIDGNFADYVLQLLDEWE
jgi:hypothetical protein